MNILNPHSRGAAAMLPELGRMADILKLTQEKPHLS
jgi:hypothetical protein